MLHRAEVGIRAYLTLSGILRRPANFGDGPRPAGRTMPGGSGSAFPECEGRRDGDVARAFARSDEQQEEPRVDPERARRHRERIADERHPGHEQRPAPVAAVPRDGALVSVRFHRTPATVPERGEEPTEPTGRATCRERG